MSQPSKNNQQDSNPSQQATKPEKPEPTPAPKLAPAPVPQDTPWKSFSIDSNPVKGTIEQEVASKPVQEESNVKDSKRATNGKEKWVVLDPAITIPAHTPQQFTKPKSKKPKSGRKSTGQKKGRGKTGSGNNSANSSAGSDKSRDSRDSRESKDSKEPKDKEAHENKDHKQSNNSQTIDRKSNKQPHNPSQSVNSGSDARKPNKPYKGRPRNASPYYQPMNGFTPVQYPPVASIENVIALIVGQVSYYFSIDNLCKDMFLRSNMNDSGYVPISLIASFHKVKSITQDMGIVAQACALCAITEVEDQKVRVKSGYEKWVLPKESRQPSGLEN